MHRPASAPRLCSAPQKKYCPASKKIGKNAVQSIHSGQCKKSLSKHINMGSSFEDLSVTNPFPKTEHDLKILFKRYLFFCLRIEREKGKKHSILPNPCIEAASERALPSTWPPGNDSRRRTRIREKAPRAGSAWTRSVLPGSVCFYL